MEKFWHNWAPLCFCIVKKLSKDGKEHRCWSIVENRHVAGSCVREVTGADRKSAIIGYATVKCVKTIHEYGITALTLIWPPYPRFDRHFQIKVPYLIKLKAQLLTDFSWPEVIERS